MEKKSIIAVILLVIGTITLPCTEVTIAAQTTVNLGSITIHGPTTDAYVKCLPSDNSIIKVGPNGNNITIQVGYSMDCPGSADDGYCSISILGSNVSDQAHTGGHDSGYLAINKFMRPGDSFRIKFHAWYTDWYGSTSLGDDTKYVDVNVQVVSQPVAGFSFSPSDPTIKNTIRFTDLSTSTDTTILSWSWSFGDGASSTEKNPTYQYQKSGTYQVTLQVTDDYGQTTSKTTPVTVKENNGIPGFELILLICALFIGIMLLKRRRKIG